jgi:hypothetical protein
MKLFVLVVALATMPLLLTGCGSDKAESKIDRSDLEKYVEENPQPIIGQDFQPPAEQ